MEPHTVLDLSDDLLERYLAGDVSVEERHTVERALRRQPAARRIVALLWRAWFASPASAGRLDDARIRQLIADRIGGFPGAEASVLRPKNASRTWERSRRNTNGNDRDRGAMGLVVGHTRARRLVAGAAAMVALVGVLIYAWPSLRPSPGVTRHYATATGQRATVELADGSRIILAPRTQLTLTNGANGRELSLVGEAHFDVTSSARVPFVVRTGAVTTRVLGTTFEVRRYPGDRLGRVLVFSGKVATAGRNAPVTLTAGMMGEFTDSSVVARATADAATYTDWTNGQLVFRKVPVPAALATLTRWYGYQFRLGDSTLAADSVTAVFTIGETGEMMRRLQHLLGVNMTFDDSVVTLRPTTGRAVDPTVHHNSHHLPLSPSTEVGR